MYITKIDHPEYYKHYDGYHHPVILHKNWQWHLGRFPSTDKLQEFLELAGLKIGELLEESPKGKAGMFRMWNVEGSIEEYGFSNLSDIPEGAKAFKGLSNGSLVTCYLINDDNVVKIYRPNPNMADIYDTMPVEDEIKYRRENGYV